jgi:hypothetical protein
VAVRLLGQGAAGLPQGNASHQRQWDKPDGQKENQELGSEIHVLEHLSLLSCLNPILVIGDNP